MWRDIQSYVAGHTIICGCTYRHMWLDILSYGAGHTIICGGTCRIVSGLSRSASINALAFKLWSLMSDEKNMIAENFLDKKQAEKNKWICGGPTEAKAGGTEGPSAGAQRGRSISTCYYFFETLKTSKLSKNNISQFILFLQKIS